MLNEILFFLGICFLSAGTIGLMIGTKYHISLLYLCIGVLFFIGIMLSKEEKEK